MYTQFAEKGLSGGKISGGAWRWVAVHPPNGQKMARIGRKMARSSVGAAVPLALALASKMGGKPRGFPGGGNPGRGWRPKMHIPY